MTSKQSINSHVLWFLAGLLCFGTVSVSGVKAEAAESVVLKYRFLRESISVPELSTFAQTGELSTSLQSYLKLANTEPDNLQQVLTKEIEVDPVFLSKVLNTLPGEVLLDQVSEIIQTPTGAASRQSLRAALVSSALPDRQITLIEILENYPTNEVYVEGDRLVETYHRLERTLDLLSSLSELRIGF